MNFDVVKEIDEQLYILANKRKQLEKRIEQRESTIKHFNEIQKQSMKRLYLKTEEQNLAARARNLKLFQEIGYASGYVRDKRNFHLGIGNARTMSKPSKELEQAKNNYLKFTEKLLPSYREHEAMQQLEALHKIQMEKEQAEQRRQVSLREMERSHLLQCAVEQERRQLVLTLALEQRDQLASVAEQRILQSQGAAVDQVIQQEFDVFGEEYVRQVNGATTRGLRELRPTVEHHFSSNRFLPAESLPLPQPRNITTSVAENFASMNTLSKIDHHSPQRDVSSKYFVSEQQQQRYQQVQQIYQNTQEFNKSGEHYHSLPLFINNNNTVTQPIDHSTTARIVHDQTAPSNDLTSGNMSESNSSLNITFPLKQTHTDINDVQGSQKEVNSSLLATTIVASKVSRDTADNTTAASKLPSEHTSSSAIGRSSLPPPEPDNSSRITLATPLVEIQNEPVVVTSVSSDVDQDDSDNEDTHNASSNSSGGLNISKENLRAPSATLPPKPPLRDVKSLQTTITTTEARITSSGDDSESTHSSVDSGSLVATTNTSHGVPKSVLALSIKKVAKDEEDEEKYFDELKSLGDITEELAGGGDNKEEEEDSSDEKEKDHHDTRVNPADTKSPLKLTLVTGKSSSGSTPDTRTPRSRSNSVENSTTQFDALFSPSASSMVLQSATKNSTSFQQQEKKLPHQLESSTDSLINVLNSPASSSQDPKLTKDLSTPQILQLFQQVSSYIETFSEPLAVRKGYGAATSSAASQARSVSVSAGVGLDRQRRLMSALLAKRDNEVVTFQVEVGCALLLRAVSENGEYILPLDLLNGVVSADKIVKSHRKLGGSRAEMWNTILAHMSAMISLKRMPQDEFAKIVTQAFISHIDISDRSRYERKVLKVLQLAIIPKEKDSTSPSGTPNFNIKTFQTDPSPTPPASPQTSLSESSSSIGSKFGSKANDLLNTTKSSTQFINEKKFLSQRAVENEKGKAHQKASGLTVPPGIAISSSGNAVLNRIQKMSKFDDDEIEDDEQIGSPPRELHDLSTLSEIQNSSRQDLSKSDEFDF